MLKCNSSIWPSFFPTSPGCGGSSRQIGEAKTFSQLLLFSSSQVISGYDWGQFSCIFQEYFPNFPNLTHIFTPLYCFSHHKLLLARDRRRKMENGEKNSSLKRYLRRPKRKNSSFRRKGDGLSKIRSINLSVVNQHREAGERRAAAGDGWQLLVHAGYSCQFKTGKLFVKRRLFNIKVLLQCANYFVIFIC